MKKLLTSLCVLLLLSVLFLLAAPTNLAAQAKVTVPKMEITQDMLNTAPEQPVGPKDAFKGIAIGFSQRRVAGSEWYEQLIRVAKGEADHLGVKLTILDAQGQNPKQVSDMEDLISKKVDAIILNPNDSSGVLTGVKEVHKAGIPLVVVNSVLDPSGGPFTFVSTFAFNTGYKSGRALADAVIKKWGWKNEIKAVVLSANPQELESDQRRWGQLAGYNDVMLEKYAKTNLKIVAFDYYQWVPDVALTKMNDILQAHQDIDVVFSACDGGAQGIIPALTNAGLVGKVLVTSIDGRKSVLKWMKDGDKGVVGDAFNDPRLMGKWAVYFAAYAAAGQPGPATFYVPNPLVTPDNVKKYYDANSAY
jgi:ribose transport system substrate-binding protein